MRIKLDSHRFPGKMHNQLKFASERRCTVALGTVRNYREWK